MILICNKSLIFNGACKTFRFRQWILQLLKSVIVIFQIDFFIFINILWYLDILIVLVDETYNMPDILRRFVLLNHFKARVLIQATVVVDRSEYLIIDFVLRIRMHQWNLMLLFFDTYRIKVVIFFISGVCLLPFVWLIIIFKQKNSLSPSIYHFFFNYYLLIFEVLEIKHRVFCKATVLCIEVSLVPQFLLEKLNFLFYLLFIYLLSEMHLNYFVFLCFLNNRWLILNWNSFIRSVHCLLTFLN